MKVISQAFVGSAVVVLAGCSGSISVGGKSIDQGSVESEISSDLTESVGVAPESIDCEGISDIAVEKDSTFVCTGTAPNGDEFDVNVTLTDDEGGFSAVVPG